MSARVLLPVIAAGGALGALARYALSAAWPHAPGAFPWATLVVNLSGCFLIGLLLTWLPRRHPDRVLLRPFLGTGLLGGYTTFSTAMVEVARGTPAMALLYLVGTAAGALLAVRAGAALAPGPVTR